jgi:nucleotide-binding universal stress UspA family protein
MHRVTNPQPLAIDLAARVVALHIGRPLSSWNIAIADLPLIHEITAACTLLRDQAECRRHKMSMKVLVAIDGSVHSAAVIDEVASRPWPAESEILVLTVVHAAAPLLPDPSLALAAAYVQQTHDLRQHAPELVRSACQQLRHSAPGLTVLTAIEEGNPKDVIVETARSWNADLIVVGSHGHSRIRRVLLGSVAFGVLTDAHCSVLVARAKRANDEHEAKPSPSFAVCD